MRRTSPPCRLYPRQQNVAADRMEDGGTMDEGSVRENCRVRCVCAGGRVPRDDPKYGNRLCRSFVAAIPVACSGVDKRDHQRVIRHADSGGAGFTGGGLIAIEDLRKEPTTAPHTSNAAWVGPGR